MAVVVTGASSDSPKDIGIVIKGRKLLQACLPCPPWFDVCTDSPLSQTKIKVYLLGPVVAKIIKTIVFSPAKKCI